MKILSLDSSTESASVALLDKDKVLGELTFNYKKQHSVILMPMIDALLKNLDLTINDVDGFAVSKGPGSFTGLRIGTAVIKGLCQGTKKPFIGISTLDSLAYNMAFTDGLICPIIDALRDNVYTALYTFENGNLKVYKEKSIMHIDELINTIKEENKNVCFVGDGVFKFREKLKQNLYSCSFAPSNLNHARASSLGELGYMLLSKGLCDNLYSFAPIYLRKSQAEREYEKKMEKSSNE